MTANTYLIDAKKQQDIYTELREMASQHQDDDVVVGAKENAKPDSLSETDVVETKIALGAEKARITVMDQARFVNVFVSRTQALRVIYDALRERDADQNGKIDATYLTKDLSVTVSEESAAVADASLLKQPEVYETSYEFNAVELTNDKRHLWNLPDKVQGVWVYVQNRDQYDNPIQPIQGFLYENQIIKEVNGVPTPDIRTFQEAFQNAIDAGGAIILTIYSGPAAYREDDGGIGSEFKVYL